MPCYDPETHERPKRLEQKVHALTAMLCYACRLLPQEAFTSNPALSEWWEKHQAHDARIAAIKEKSDRLGDAALTPEERGELYFANDISYHYDFPRTIVIDPASGPL